MAVLEKTRNMLWALSAGRCAYCKNKLVVESKKKNFSLVGEVAHIVAQKEDGPRGKHSLPLSKRDNLENLVLLCKTHHKLVDDHVDEFSVSDLTTLREEHFKWVSNKLNEPRQWECNLSQLTYINVPRLSMLSSRLGYEVDLDEYGKFETLYSLRWSLNKLMRQFLSTLNKINVNTLDFSSVNYPDIRLVGATCSISDSFRTKNVPMIGRDDKDPVTFCGDLKKDPHIYKKYPNFKLVMRIQPSWITTSTAFLAFRPSGGVSTFSGLITVSEVDVENSVIYAIPLVLGLPVSDFELMMKEPKLFREEDSSVVGKKINKKTSLIEFEDLEKAIEQDTKYVNPPDCCDVCRASLENQTYFVDGAIKSSSAWAFLCEYCFEKDGVGIGWGLGQLFKKNKHNEWLLVGGFAPESDDDYYI
ncbi:HNH endonuclease [Vibrio parahaemolyticus]|uniref:HNH endonuclease n=1 Tax=Vibrio parahaemolyticus TaxID=670 RepID=UPI00069DB85C|nr:HNH endonuclease signature motif containing protein [Vibrio parahaemolyticus]EGQ9318293.1 HNH endonuclease [Vibrio parahaemolyticus]EHH2503356.1 HNH endonuclease [Vibrio parahaemolyticus]EJG1475189.1 HNH endonuclease [Vibrio parahaemolyticus]EKA7408022.1 HNH endonuclease [Vibrio parahaemolyticus]EKG9660705.1 HNH endonuclease [Vibrio parahaemolyticus]